MSCLYDPFAGLVFEAAGDTCLWYMPAEPVSRICLRDPFATSPRHMTGGGLYGICIFVKRGRVFQARVRPDGVCLRPAAFGNTLVGPSSGRISFGFSPLDFLRLRADGLRESLMAPPSDGYFKAASCSLRAAILASASACLARSLATTFSGADCTKRSFESFFITEARKPS